MTVVKRLTVEQVQFDQHLGQGRGAAVDLCVSSASPEAWATINTKWWHLDRREMAAQHSGVGIL